MQLIALLRSLLLLAAIAVPSLAQCTPQWQPGDPMQNMHGTVNASVSWDPDGSGPSLPVLVVGGSFAVQSIQTNIAMFDGTQWASLGNLPASYVTALAVYGGDLVAAGPVPGSPGVSRVWLWSGGSWLPLGAPGNINGGVAAMVAFNGWLVIGGFFPTLDGLNLHSLAKWDGTGWSAVGSSFIAGVVGSVKALAVFNGEMHVAGDFTQVTTIPVDHHAVFNGAAWAPGAVFNAPIETLAVRTGIAASSSYLLAGGSFTTVFTQASGVVAASHVARMQQSTGLWSVVGSGLGGTKCTRLCVRPTSLLGYEVMASVEPSPSTMWQWFNSTGTWTNVGTIADTGSLPSVTTIGLSANQFVLGLQSANNAMRTFVSSNWNQPLATQGISGAVAAQCMLGSDQVIAGSFDSISGVPMHNIARGHANAWQPLGGGLTGGFGVKAVVTLPNGDLVAAGSFTSAGGVPANNIARWNGTSWAPLGAGFGGIGTNIVIALCVLPNGDLIAGGLLQNSGPLALQNLARWNGTTWSSFGGTNNLVYALTRMPNGDVIAGGAFTSIGGLLVDRVARWDGSSWVAMGLGLFGDVTALVGLPDGSVVAGGQFTSPGPYCARWDGASWVGVQAFGFRPTSAIRCLAALPDGDVVAGGAEWNYTSSLPPAQVRTNLARLDLSGPVPMWSSLDLHGASVVNVAMLPDGSLSAVGEFDIAGPHVSGNVARLVPPCPALATSSGAGCNGCTLNATTLPWVDATFRATGTNLPTTAFVITVTSVTSLPQGAQPLAAIFAQGQPGCDVLVAPDILDVLITTNGTATSSLFLAVTPSILGATFFHQMIPLAVNAQGAWTSITATNALRLTAGIF